MGDKKKDLEIIKRLFDDFVSMYEKVLPIWKTEELESLKKYSNAQDDAAEFPFHFQILLFFSKITSFSKITLEKFPKKQITELVDPEIMAFDLLSQFPNIIPVLQKHRRAVYFSTALIFLKDEYRKKLNGEFYGEKVVDGDLLGTKPEELPDLLRMLKKTVKPMTRIIEDLSCHNEIGQPIDYEIIHDLKEELSADAIPLREYLPDNLPDELRAFMTKICDQCDPGKAKLLSAAAAGKFRLLETEFIKRYSEAIDKLKTKKRGYFIDNAKLEKAVKRAEHIFKNNSKIRTKFKTDKEYLKFIKNKFEKINSSRLKPTESLFFEDGNEIPRNETIEKRGADIDLFMRERLNSSTKKEKRVVEFSYNADELVKLHEGLNIDEKTFRDIRDRFKMKVEGIDEDEIPLQTYRDRKKRKPK